MTLTERRKQILYAVVEEHIRKDKSVASGYLSSLSGIDYSPATIRNELVALEQEGYLEQPHTSAGRIPTFKGYRTFVDNLLPIQPLSDTDMALLLRNREQVFNSVDEILTSVLLLTSQLSDYAVVMSMSESTRHLIKYLQLILLNVHQVLVVLLSNTGKNKDFIINFEDAQLSQEELNKLSRFLHEMLVGRDLSCINGNDIQKIIEMFPIYHAFLQKALDMICSHGQFLQEQSFSIKNSSKLVNQSDFKSIEQIRQIVHVLENEKMIACYLKDTQGSIQFLIGDEAHNESLRDMSLVYESFSNSSGPVGCMGILGPKRMDYARSATQIKTAVQFINEELERICNTGGEV